MSKTIERFVNVYKNEDVETKYNAGKVYVKNGRCLVNGEQYGAEETFSIGQPVYDENGELLGYLGITLLENLGYSAEMRIPCDVWEICMPSKFCKHGTEIFTYWQNRERSV